MWWQRSRSKSAFFYVWRIKKLGIDLIQLNFIFWSTRSVAVGMAVWFVGQWVHHFGPD